MLSVWNKSITLNIYFLITSIIRAIILIPDSNQGVSEWWGVFIVLPIIAPSANSSPEDTVPITRTGTGASAAGVMMGIAVRCVLREKIIRGNSSRADLSFVFWKFRTMMGRICILPSVWDFFYLRILGVIFFQSPTIDFIAVLHPKPCFHTAISNNCYLFFRVFFFRFAWSAACKYFPLHFSSDSKK